MNDWKNIIQLNSVDSTNNYVSNVLKHEKLEEGSIIFTLDQTAGKGQANNSWVSKPNENILMSLILYPNFIEITNQFRISKAISLGIISYCNEYTGDISIKWPNDIYHKNRKIAGILIENSLKGRLIERSIIGIGLNLNQEQFSSNAPNATSIKNITKSNFIIKDEIIKLREHISLYYNKLQLNPEQVDREYLENMFRFGKIHQYKVDEKTIEGKILGVNEFGHLQLETNQYEIKEFDLKEIEFII